MNNNLTDITIILDESGSMEYTKHDTIGGFNALIEKQLELSKENPDSAVDISFYTFSDYIHNQCRNKRLDSSIKLDTKNYVPKGGTALLDAIGVGITETGDRLRLTLESARPGKVLFIIITDGEENSSRAYTDYHKIADMIKLQEDVYNWEFIFMGADQDVIANAGRLNIKAQNTHSYVKTSGGIHASYAVMDNVITSNRLGIKKKDNT